ncbi:hypothetical protein H0H87_008954 [Tephrocybe sp. NHM501043]|nr:hypothetical protein H0H87_008954 [Tephrocybe sp. NHM501043]
MTTYTIRDRDFLNSSILPDEPDRFAAYTTTTTRTLQGPKITTLIPSVDDHNDSLLGEINWKEQTFSIGGVAVRWDDLKSKPNGVSDSTREWHWVGKKFWVKYNHNIWQVC